MKKILRRKEKERNSQYMEVKAKVDPSNHKKNHFLFCFTPVKTIGLLFLIAIVGLISYSNSFIVPFQFDDIYNIAENPVVRDLDNFTSSLSGYNQNPRRFVGYFTFALNYAAGGTDVRGYHIVNLIIHIVNGCLLYLLVILTFRTPCFASWKAHSSSGASPVTDYGSRFIALFTALFFVSHPVQTQAVTYIVQRLTSLATFFYLLSVVLYAWGRIAGVERSGGRAVLLYVLSVLSAVLAMKTKEIAFTLPLAVVLYEWTFFQAPWRKRLLILLPVVLTLIIVPLSVMGTDKPLGEVLSDLSEKSRVQTDIPRWDYLVTQMRVITTYIRLIFLPVNQNLDYDYPVYRSLFDPPVLTSFLFLVVVAGFGVYLLYVSRLRGKGKAQSTEVRSGEDPLPAAWPF
jgi:hypothetical protein